MQLERLERERLQKMGTSSLQSRKKRSFSLPLSFRRSSAGERRQEAAASSEKAVAARSTAEEAARVQKAAAWQWYTRGVGEAVVPTKRPPVAPYSPLGLHQSGRSEVGSGEAITDHDSSTVLQKKPPALAESAKAASRFKAEARFGPPTSAGAKPTPSAGPSTPLFDDFDLSGLRTQMADFVQRLQLHHQTKYNERPPARINSKPLHRAAAVDGRLLPAAASTDHHHIKLVPSVGASVSSDHDQLSKPPRASAAPRPVPSAIPSFHMRPFSALHRLFRKVVSGSIKSTKNSPLLTTSPPAIYETEVLPEEEGENTPLHYHHYIHHHHHHYHYGQSPENSAAIIRSRRRHSESSGFHPHIPSLMEGESDEDEEEIERSSIEAYLARRIRRHSDSFAGTPQKADSDEGEKNLKGDSAEEALPRQLPRMYNSERFSPNKIPTTVSEDLTQPTTDEFDEGFPDVRRRRRHSTESQREGASLERKAEGGGKSGGGTIYKLSGAAADGATLVRRRHSEGLQRPEGVHYETGKRSPCWNSGPAARYLEDMLERQIGASANAANARPRRSGLPPVYPE